MDGWEADSLTQVLLEWGQRREGEGWGGAGGGESWRRQASPDICDTRAALSGRVHRGLMMSRLSLSHLFLLLLFPIFSALLSTTDAQTCAGYDCLKVLDWIEWNLWTIININPYNHYDPTINSFKSFNFFIGFLVNISATFNRSMLILRTEHTLGPTLVIVWGLNPQLLAEAAGPDTSSTSPPSSGSRLS